jgi:hypothetical protein
MGFTGRYIERKITEVLTKLFSERGKITPPAGFVAAAQLRGCTEEWVVVPFSGHPICVKLRVLGAGEFPEVSLLEIINKNTKLETWKDKVDFRNTLEYYARHALVEPSFTFFEEEVWGKQGAVKEMRARFAALKKEAETYELGEAETAELQELEQALGYCLPLDTMRAIACWCECIDSVDNKKITHDDLILAYSLSQHYHNRASDNLNGAFLEHSRKEIDILAAKLWHEKYGKKK